jgi:hypothetical protein
MLLTSAGLGYGKWNVRFYEIGNAALMPHGRRKPFFAALCRLVARMFTFWAKKSA